MSNPERTIGETNTEAKSKRPQRSRPVRAADQSDGWVDPPSAGFAGPGASRSRSSSRKRRIYADYREMLSLESQARKLNFLGPDDARSLQAGEQMRERAFDFQEPNVSEITTGVSNQLELLVQPTFATERSAVLVVDQRMSMFFGSRRNLKSVVAANAAALISWQVLARRKHLSTIVFNDRKIVQSGPGCGRLHTLLFLQTILSQNHSLLPDAGINSNPGMLNDALRRVNKLATGNDLVLLITDASGCDRETLRLSTDISQRNDLVVTLIYDPQQAEFCSPAHFAGDNSRSKFENRKSARVLREKNQSAAERQRILAGRLFPDGIPVIPLNTRDDVAYQLRRAFSKSWFSSFVRGRSSPEISPPTQAQL